MRAFEHGSRFTDRGSGLTVVAAHPGEAPRLWRAYLDRAEAQYRRHGTEAALERERIEDGRTVSLFWVALDTDVVVAGVRCHGPLASATEARALVELRDHPDLDRVRADIAAAARHGLIELKGGWVAAHHRAGRALSAVVGRCALHSMEWFGARFAICTASHHALRRWRIAGGRVADGLPPVAYPDQRFQTYLLWWDRHDVSAHADAEQIRLFAAESGDLVGGTGIGRQAATDAPVDPREEWRPRVLREDDPADGARLAALRADPAVAVIDRVADQRRELAALRPACPPELLAEAPRWVLYPWRRALVRLLGPSAFRRLRLDRNRNKLTAEEQERLIGWSVGVVGLSVGHAIAHALALEGLCGRLVLADFDQVMASNLNRVPATVLDIGVNKAVVTARRLAELDPYLDVAVWPAGVGADDAAAFVAEVDVLVEECDSLDVKMALRAAARRRRVPVLMETSDRGLLDVERFDLEPERAPFHGLMGELGTDDLAGLSVEDKAPHVLRLVEPDELSPRAAASMAEIGETVSTWPQLGSDVALGAATIASAVRRLARGQPLPSGRLRIDLDERLEGLAAPAEPPRVDLAAAVPRQPTPRDAHRAVAHAAHLAPSGGNTQPWRLELTEGQLRLHLDRTRTSTLDQGFRGSCTAIGAALLNARAAASAHGRLGAVTPPRPGDDGDEDLIATLTLGDRTDAELAELYPHVLARHTNRQPGEPASIGEATAAALHAAADREGAELHLTTDRAVIAECGDVLGESDRLRYLTPWLHEDVMRELRWPGRDPLETGIDVRTLELDPADLAKLAMVRRADVMAQLSAWDAGHALGAPTRGRVRTSSGLAAVTVSGDDRAAYVRGGSAAERVWIEAQRAGLSVQPVSPVFIYAVADADYAALVGAGRAASLRSLDERLRRLVGLAADARLVLLLRLSHAPAASLLSGRRPLDQVLSRPTPASAAHAHRPARSWLRR